MMHSNVDPQYRAARVALRLLTYVADRLWDDMGDITAELQWFNATDVAERYRETVDELLAAATVLSGTNLQHDYPADTSTIDRRRVIAHLARAGQSAARVVAWWLLHNSGQSPMHAKAREALNELRHLPDLIGDVAWIVSDLLCERSERNG